MWISMEEIGDGQASGDELLFHALGFFTGSRDQDTKAALQKGLARRTPH